jgi:hypothetical protein
MAEYTGRGLTPQMPKDDGRAMGRLSDFILRAEEMKYSAFKENEKEFLKASNIDPAFFISTANQKAQTRLLDEFNKKWAGKWKDTGYKMSSEDKMQMQAEKNFVLSQQQEMLAKQKMWEEEDSLVKRNPGDFDEKEHALKTAEYMNTGSFDHSSLPYRAQSVADDLMKLRGKIGQTTSVTGPLAGNPNFQQTIETTGTREDVAPVIIDRVFSNPRIKKDMMQKWNDLPQTEKDKYLDVDGVDGVSEEERRMGSTPAKDKENPILKFYIDQNYKYGIIENPSTPQKVTTGTESKVTGVESIVGKKRDIDPRYGNISRPNVYSLGGDVYITDLPTVGAKMLDDMGSYDYNSKGNPAKAYLKDYDADKKTLIVQVTARDPGSFIETKQLIEIPVKNVMDKVKDVKVEVDGKMTTIGALAGQETTSTTETPAERLRRLAGKEGSNGR